MTQMGKLAAACLLVAVLLLCVLPSGAVPPTALRAWHNALALVAVLSTLFVLACALPERFEAVSERESESPRCIDPLALTCSMLC